MSRVCNFLMCAYRTPPVSNKKQKKEKKKNKSDAILYAAKRRYGKKVHSTIRYSETSIYYRSLHNGNT